MMGGLHWVVGVLCFFLCRVWCASLNETALANVLKGLKGSSSWITDDPNPCNWQGVTCASAASLNVTSLSLSGFSLAGTLPKDIALLHSLISINFSHNSLTGSIPSEWGQNLAHLQYLDLSHNELLGSIPTTLANLTSLQKLILHSNFLNGSIPAEFANLRAIRELSLSWNELTGRIPSGMSLFGKLENFSAYHNFLTGAIPPISNSSTLRSVNLASNYLSGAIPIDICSGSQLTTLILTDNFLNGSIPALFGNCTSLTTLRVGNNAFAGGISDSLGSLQNLVYFEADRNWLSGQISSDVFTWEELILLNLANNNFTGHIPPEINQALSLQELRLSNNSFTGPIPEDLFSLWRNLSVLHLGGNLLTGSLPQNLSALARLRNLRLEDNSFSGAIPSSIGGCAQLLELHLGNNKLSGNIPAEIGNLFNLQISLNLSFNELDGSIPDTLGKLSLLVSLDLSHNQLSGSIPSTMDDMSSLLDWNFSSNLLAGPVPVEGPFKNSRASSFANNAGLCGGPLPACGDACRGAGACKAMESRNMISTLKLIVITGSVVLFLAFLVWMLLVQCRRACLSSAKQQELDVAGNGYIRLSQREVLDLTAGFHHTTLIGAGGLSTVHSATLADGQEVAIKKLREGNLPKVTKHAFITELKVLSRVRHRNMVKVLGFTWEPKVKALLLELIPNGTLHMHLHEVHPCRLDWSTRVQIAVGVAEALAYLHYDLLDFAVVHCDVKPSNILLDMDMNPKLSDLGIARIIASSLRPNDDPGVVDVYSMTSSMIVRGSLGYIAPEYAFSRRLTPAADVFSFGMVLLELITGRQPTDESLQSTKAGTLRGWVQEIMTNLQLANSSTADSNHEDFLDPDLLQNPSSPDHELRPPTEQVMRLTSVALTCSSENASCRPTMRAVLCVLRDLISPEYRSSPADCNNVPV